MAQLAERDELALNPVPANEKTSWVAPLFNMLGCNIALSELMLGGALIAGLTFKNFLMVSLVGNGILVIAVLLQGYIGAREGLNTYVLAKGAFGDKGGQWLIAVLLAITSFGWFGVQAGVAGQSILAMMPNVPLVPIIIVVGAVMTLCAAFGFHLMAKLNYVAIPLLIILMIWGTYTAISQSGGLSTIWTYTPNPASALSITTAINMVVGLVIVGAIIAPDQTRYTSGAKSVFIIGFGGIALISILQQAAAAAMGIAGGSSDIPAILVGLGFGAAALGIIVLAAVSTNVVNAYSGGLAAKTVLPNVSRLTLTIVAGGVGTLMAATGLTDDFPRFLSVLGIFVPSVAGVMWAEYYLIRGKSFVIRPGVNAMAVIGWIAGSIVSWLSSRYGFGLPPINGILASGIIYLALMKLNPKGA